MSRRTRRLLLLALTAALASGASAWLLTALAARRGGPASPSRDAVLNGLRNDINAHYGYLDGVPRVNRGPCGRFARAFCEQWNARFRAPAHIAFVMPDDGGECCHVLVLLPGGGYFDGGNGVLSEEALLALHPGCRVEVMATFDPGLLDRRSGGLGRTYGRCPNYSDAVTAAIIAKHLALLAGDLGGP
jgi:hypothetical protein